MGRRKLPELHTFWLDDNTPCPPAMIGDIEPVIGKEWHRTIRNILRRHRRAGHKIGILRGIGTGSGKPASVVVCVTCPETIDEVPECRVILGKEEDGQLHYCRGLTRPDIYRWRCWRHYGMQRTPLPTRDSASVEAQSA